MEDYIDLLQEELQDARNRLKRADQEGQRIVQKQIGQIERDIRRNSTKDEDHPSI